MTPKTIYTDEFKLHVVKTYITSPSGMRMTARDFGLPSKNYISNWIIYLKKHNMLSENDLLLLRCKSSQTSTCISTKTSCSMSPTEKLLTEENIRLKAELELLHTIISIDSLQSKKK